VKVPAPADFEIRLIIWETIEIPKSPNKNVVDIYIRAVLDSSATGLD